MFKKFRKKLKSSYLYDLLTNYFGKYKKSYSENFGEDLFVNYFFKDVKEGFYIDIGCNLPKNSSLTYLLYKKGWRGINVDISKRVINLNKVIRPRDINLNISIGKEEKIVNSYIFYDNCSMNTVDKKFSEYTQKSVNKKPKIVKIQQRMLDSVLEKFKVNKINYLNIDVEGNEMNTLDGFSLHKFSPDLVSIEIHDKICPPLSNKIYKYFLDKKYYLVSIYGWTYFFSKKNNNKIHFNI